MTTAPAPASLTIPRLLAMLSRAATLRERLEGAIDTTGDGPVARARLDRWCQVVGRGDPVLLRRRLEWDGLTLPDALAALGEPRGVDAEAPRWLKMLAVVLAHSSAVEAGDPAAGLSADDPPVPFGEVLRPFVTVAAAQLYGRVHPALGGLGSGARLALERALLLRLAAVCGPALYRAFDVKRAVATSPLERLVSLGLGTSDGYRAFVAGMQGGGLERFFVEHPVLGRLAASAALDWIDSSAELMQRLAEDRPELTLVFGGGVDPGDVVGIRAGLSDPHDGGRSVLRVDFASGLRVAYKPRAVGLEKGYRELVDWLNGRGAEPPLRAPQVLAGSGYGWVEWIDQEPAADMEAARRYFRRSGMLMALFYGLGSTDCHQHNLVAAGEHPVLVDAETLLHPRVLPHGSPAEVAGARTAARRWMEESVFEADFLPTWSAAADGLSMDISGLGGVERQRSVILGPRWERVGTDAMSLAYVYEDLEAPTSALKLDGSTALPWDFRAEVVGGFESLHRLLQDGRDQVLAPGGPLDRLAGSDVRLIIRPTLVYQKLLDACSRPALLAEGADRSIELELIARPLLASDTQDPLSRLHRQEQAALERLDIPRFTIPAGGRALGAGGGAGEDVFAASALEHAAERLARFDEGDREQQVALVQLALEIRGGPAEAPAHPEEVAAAGAAPAVAAGAAPAGEVTDEELLGVAAALGDRLERSAIVAPDGGLTWIGLSHDQPAGGSSLRPVGLDLYGGQSGVAVFFAGLAAAAGEDRFRSLALRTLRPVLEALAERPDRVAEEVGVGGGTGLGSLVYGLVACARLLKEPALLAAAESAAGALSPRLIDTDSELDVVAGSAGAILGLLSLYEATGSEPALLRAAACGDHLLARRSATPSGFRAWRSHSEQPLAGLAHGAAGVAYALLLAAHACERPDFREAAEEAMRYEATLFDPEQRNWADLRPAAASRTGLSAWCHGASGIALARLGALDVEDSPEIRAEVAAAVLTTRATGPGSSDQVCCGAMGRVETLLVAGERLSAPQLTAAAREIAATVLGRADQLGRFRLAGGAAADGYSPGFFQGQAGIGYELLRLVRPDLPSVLLFEVN